MELVKAFYYFIAIIILTLLIQIAVVFGECQADSPQSLIDSIKENFVQGNIENFSCLYLPESGIELLKESIKEKYEREFGTGKIIRSNGKKAILLMTGLVKTGYSGYDIYYAEIFSGIYEAEFSNNSWKVTRALPYRKNVVNSQTLDVEVFPAQKLSVRDLLSIDVNQDFGFAIPLNPRARILKTQFNGNNVEYVFSGGLFWANIPLSKKAKLLIEYDLEVDSDKDGGNSSFWDAQVGHVRNQFYWHPFYDFKSQTDQAIFKIVARIPKEFQLVTSLPQTNSVNEKYRVITATSEGKTEALSLLYDRNWQVSTKNFGNLRFDVFATPEFTPSLVDIQNEFQKVYKFLEAKFGKPPSNYFNVVQSRGRSGNGWHYHSNNSIVAGKTGGLMTRKGSYPRAFFPHEVAHAWTIPTGDGSNFLREGWASFVESYFLREEYGAKTEDDYFAKYRELYEKENFEGNVSILSDSDNSGVSYYKGAWIFRMLRDFIGEEEFMRGMRKYIFQTNKGKGDINSFISAFSSVSKKNVVSFLNPWLEEKFIPKISANIVNGKLEIKQVGRPFFLPLEVEFETTIGKTRKTFLIAKKIEIFDLSKLGEIKNLEIDPNNRILLKKV